MKKVTIAVSSPPPSLLFCCKEGDDKRHLLLSRVTFFSLFEEGVAYLFFACCHGLLLMFLSKVN
jgi:hypothetical protein